MIQTRDLTAADIYFVACGLRADEWENVRLFGGPLDAVGLTEHCHRLPGPRWCFAAGSTPLICGGLIPQRRGVFQSWQLVSDYAWANYPREVTDWTAGRVKWMLDNGAHRVETLSLASRKRAHRWYETVGLRFESTLKNYCIDGSDAVMYVATKDKP